MAAVIQRLPTALRRPIGRLPRPMPNVLQSVCIGAAHLFDFGNTLHRPFVRSAEFGISCPLTL